MELEYDVFRRRGFFFSRFFGMVGFQLRAGEVSVCPAFCVLLGCLVYSV